LLFQYKGYDIPVDLVNLTGAGPDTFDVISRGHIEYLQKYVGINANSNVLEIGCGIGRDAIPLTEILSEESGGRYLGVDIIGRSIKWCRDNIAARHHNFKFVHFDVKDQLHNDNGTMATSGIVIPLENNSVDKIILWSVFTHMFKSDIVHYLNEFRRVLKKDGVVFFSCFVVNDEILSSINTSAPTPYALRFATKYGRGCWINDPVHPAGAVAYDGQALHRFAERAGFKISRYIPGNWSGLRPNAPTTGQDGIILTAAPVRAQFGRLLRNFGIYNALT